MLIIVRVYVWVYECDRVCLRVFVRIYVQVSVFPTHLGRFEVIKVYDILFFNFTFCNSLHRNCFELLCDNTLVMYIIYM